MGKLSQVWLVLIVQIRRPFQFINSKIFVRSSKEEDGKLIGEAQQCVSSFASCLRMFIRVQGMAPLAETVQCLSIVSVEILRVQVWVLICHRRRNEDTFSQFARIDSGLFAWDFWLKDRNDRGSYL